MHSSDHTKTATIVIQLSVTDANLAPATNTVSDIAAIQSLGLHEIIGQLVERLSSIRSIVNGFAQVGISTRLNVTVVSHTFVALLARKCCLVSSVCSLYRTLHPIRRFHLESESHDLSSRPSPSQVGRMKL